MKNRLAQNPALTPEARGNRQASEGRYRLRQHELPVVRIAFLDSIESFHCNCLFRCGLHASDSGRTVVKGNFSSEPYRDKRPHIAEPKRECVSIVIDPWNAF